MHSQAEPELDLEIMWVNSQRAHVHKLYKENDICMIAGWTDQDDISIFVNKTYDYNDSYDEFNHYIVGLYGDHVKVIKMHKQLMGIREKLLKRFTCEILPVNDTKTNLLGYLCFGLIDDADNIKQHYSVKRCLCCIKFSLYASDDNDRITMRYNSESIELKDNFFEETRNATECDDLDIFIEKHQDIFPKTFDCIKLFKSHLHEWNHISISFNEYYYCTFHDDIILNGKKYTTDLCKNIIIMIFTDKIYFIKMKIKNSFDTNAIHDEDDKILETFELSEIQNVIDQLKKCSQRYWFK